MKLRIKELRDAKGWKVSDLSYASRVPVDTIYKYEREALTNPGAALLKKLADALGVTIDELIVQEDE
jgi:transcriptional regulator with XRE-family HTH domain